MSVNDDFKVIDVLFKYGLVGVGVTGPVTTFALDSLTDWTFFSCFLGGAAVCALTAYVPAFMVSHQLNKNC